MKKNHDKITDAYYGAFGTELMDSSRERIHWICANAKGETILDIGCSQGICPILLGREGKQALGLDMNAESISYAKDALAQEEEGTRQNVNFLCANFTSCEEIRGKQFDVIILSEILEHLTDPVRFLKHTLPFLHEEGRILVTVPFGITQYFDHKRNYFLTEIFNELSEVYQVEKVKFFGSWIGLVGRKKSVKLSQYAELNGELFRLAEQAIEGRELDYQKKQNELMTQNGQNKDAIAQLQQEKGLFEEKNRLLLQELEKKQAEISALEQGEKERLALIETHAALKMTVLDSQSLIQRLSQELEKKQAEILILEKQNKENTALIETHTTLALTVSELQKKEKELNGKLRAVQICYRSWKEEYHKLAASKLGRIQVYYWRRKGNKRKKKRMRFLTWLKGQLKRVPFLVALVRKIRGTSQTSSIAEIKKEIAQTKQDLVQPALPFDTHYFDTVKELIAQLPESSSGRYYRRDERKVGIISDEFLYNTYKDVADCVAIHPDYWQEQVSDIDLLLIITGWRGIKEEWRGFSREGSYKRGIIYQVINACREKKVPSVFYTIEDPPNYALFLGIAQRCDYVYTTAVEMVEKYKTDCGHDRVHALRFAINPMYHNPVGCRHFPKKREVIFSGSWMRKYPERGKDIRILFDGVLESGRKLKIIDRNFDVPDEQYRFPNKYAVYISPAVGHEDLQKIHKLYNWAININSVKESATMFANRVYELEAEGNLLISNYSVGVNSYLPVVYTAEDSHEVAQILNGWSDEEIYQRQVTGIRHAMSGQTCFDRYNEILENMGFSIIQQQRRVAVLVETITPEIEEMFSFQTYFWKELLPVSQLESRKADFDALTFWDPQMDYGPFYLEDMMNAFKYVDCDYITKTAFYQGDNLVTGVEHEFVSVIPSKYRTLFWSESFTAEELHSITDNTYRSGGYATDHFNYNQRRWQKPLTEREYKLSVIVPVYNNGQHLYGKAFSSLRRSSIFSDMEIILVDDGSTDLLTLQYVRSLEQQYPNVRSYSFGDGGSGSASRPRNKGVELATAAYITFLDPDNEAVNDGYARLYELAVSGKYDLVVGNMIRCRETWGFANYYHYFTKRYGSDIVTRDKAEFLERIGFTPMSIQAMVIRREIITSSGIEQVVGAVGQDSFFSLQLFYHAKNIRAVDLPVHIYYALVSGSTVNTVKKRFFERSLILEKAEYLWFKEKGLLASYMHSRFNTYFRDWMLKKLSMVLEEDMEESVKIVYEMYTVYQNEYNKQDTLINEFANLCEKGSYQQAYQLCRKYFP